jgi:hypothetical protein
MKVFINNGLRHPLRALKIAFRRIFLNLDNKDPLWDGGAVPAPLQKFAVGEILPWKGISFRVGKVIGGDFPMVILIPADRTRGAKLQSMRNFRDLARQVRDNQQRLEEEACSRGSVKAS